MSYLLKSSIGKKLIMSISGTVLILFLIFHATMNVVVLISEEAYNDICGLLGANWYAVAGTVAIAGIIAIHFIYAFYLTAQNRKARGSSYAVNERPKGVSFVSQNMLVLGIIICGFMLLHFAQYWYKMMFFELTHEHGALVELGGKMVSPQDGAAFVKYYFSHLWVVVAYLVWYVALWFHLSHGIWSAFQSMGLNGRTWYPRIKGAGTIFATLLMLAFAAVTIITYAKSFCGTCI